MNARTLLLLALLATLAATLLYFSNQDPAAIDAGPSLEGAGLAPDAPAAPAGDAPGDLPAPPERRDEVAQATPSARTEAAPATVEADGFVVPSGAQWVDGLVIFPDATPYEEEVRVVARGKRFGDDRDAPRERTVAVGRDGKFRVPYSEDTTKGWLDLEASYLYLSERMRLQLDELEGQHVVVKPLLGGRIVGRVLPPPGVLAAPEVFEGMTAQVYNWQRDDNLRRAASVAEDGTFAFDALPPGGGYHLALDSSRFRAEGVEDQHVEAGEDAELELQLALGVHLAGSVLDAAGEPIPGTQLRIEVVQEEGRSTHSQTTPVDGDGSFDEGGLEPGEFTISIEAPGYSLLTRELGELEDGAELTTLELVPSAGRSLAGRVQWQDGTPAGGARVVVLQANEEGNFDWTARELAAEADEEGAFVVEGLDDRSLIVEASGRQMLPPEPGSRRKRPRRGPLLRAKLEDVQAGQAGLLLVLGEGHAVVGTVVDDRGQPVTEFAVEAQPVVKEQDYANYKAQEDERVGRFDDPAGAFELKGLSEGRWRLRAVVAREDSRGEWLELGVPQAEPATLRLPRVARLAGVVRTPSGEPAIGAKVQVSVETRVNGSTYFSSHERTSDTTDSEGRFEVDAVTPGKVQVEAQLSPYAPSATLELQVAPADEQLGLVLQLQVGGRITGEVHPYSAPIEGRRVHCWGPNYGENALTDAQGRFAFEGLPPGSFSLQLDVGGDGEGLRNVDNQQVELAAAGSEHVVLGAPPDNPVRVFGRVTVGGEPAEGFRVTMHRDGDSYGGKTDATGAYELTVNGPGRYSFNVARGSQNIGTNLQIAEVREQRHDVELPTASVSGRLVDEEGEPVDQVSVSLVRSDLPQEDRSRSARHSWTQGGGGFRFEFLEEGTYELRYAGAEHGFAGGRIYAAQVVTGLQVRAGEARAGLEYRLEEPARAVVLVVDAAGNPLEHHWVTVELASGVSLSLWPSGSTDAGGRIELQSLPGAELTFRAGGSAGSGSTRARTAQGRTTDVRIVVAQ